ncbi:MAG: hypothetical protein GY940_44350 [bacterium]|nr:hypothetical protein [bacterium]
MQTDVKKKRKAKQPNLKERLSRMFTALSNSLKEPMLGKLSSRGYGAEKIKGLLSLHGKVKRLDYLKGQAYAAQTRSTEIMGNVYREVKKTYYKLRQLAQAALKDEPSTLELLQLDRRVSGGISGFLSHVRGFYRAIADDDELEVKLAAVNLTREEVAQELPKLDQLEQLNIQQQKDKKAARDATGKRDTRVRRLEREYADFYRVAKIALADEKSYLKMLNIKRHH